MKRITAEDIQAAVDKTGLRLVYGSWGRELVEEPAMSCGCPITILYIAAGHDWPSGNLADLVPHPIKDWADEVYGVCYVSGFIDGFDGRNCSDSDMPDVVTGHSDGKAARIKLLPDQSQGLAV